MIKPQILPLGNRRPCSFPRVRKAALMALRKMTRSAQYRYKFAGRLHCWADLQLCYSLPRVWILPSWFYRLLNFGCNFVASKNTIDHETLRCKRLQRWVEWLIHRVPDEIRFDVEEC